MSGEKTTPSTNVPSFTSKVGTKATENTSALNDVRCCHFLSFFC